MGSSRAGSSAEAAGFGQVFFFFPTVAGLDQACDQVCRWSQTGSQTQQQSHDLPSELMALPLRLLKPHDDFLGCETFAELSAPRVRAERRLPPPSIFTVLSEHSALQ